MATSGFLEGVRRGRRARALPAVGMAVVFLGYCQTPAAAQMAIPVPAASFVGSAASGTIHQAAGAGLTMTVDSRWISGPAYRPLKVALRSATPLVADRTLTFQFMVGSAMQGQDGYQLCVAETIEMPAGSSVVEKTISIPGANLGGDYYWRVVENGRLVKGLSSTWVPSARNPVAAVQDLPRLLVISPADTPVDTTPISQAARGATDVVSVQFPGQTGTGLVDPFPTAMVRAPADLPDRWIDYTSLDLVAASLDQLSALKQQEPAKFQAIVHWTAAGGNLVVWGVGSDRQGLDRLESLLGVAVPAASAEKPENRDWIKPDKQLLTRPMMELRTAFDMAERYGGVARATPMPQSVPSPFSSSKEAKLPEEKPASPAVEPGLLYREFGLGLVVAMSTDGRFPQRRSLWNGAFNTIGQSRLTWVQRHGLSTMGENPEFWSFLIPGVGMTPVLTFEILITLFVVGIGPANYFLLRRWKRLHLLVVTVPLSAAVVTLALFGYAMVADGLTTQVRVRSFTHLDQARGEAVCWARLSYYCGLTPSGGLRFPADVAVHAFEASPGESVASARELIWGENQWLWRGWVAARVPIQLLTVRSRKSDAGLDVFAAGGAAKPAENPAENPAGKPAERPAEGQPGTPSVRNRLGTRIQYLVVCAEDGQYYTADPLEPGQSAPLRPVSVPLAESDLRQRALANAPAFPHGVDAAAMQSYYSGRRMSYRRMRAMGFSLPWSRTRPVQGSSRLEQALDDATSPRGARGGPPWGLHPRSYVAVVDRSPEVVLGVNRAREQGGFHVIRGTW